MTSCLNERNLLIRQLSDCLFIKNVWRFHLSIFHLHRRDSILRVSISILAIDLLRLLLAEDMQQDAIDTASTAMEKYTTDKEIAGYIKKEFDKKYDPTWHCIVGRNFGMYLTHEDKNFIHFFINQYGVLLMKAG
jgi:dynein light chain LC8-type